MASSRDVCEGTLKEKFTGKIVAEMETTEGQKPRSIKLLICGFISNPLKVWTASGISFVSQRYNGTYSISLRVCSR